MSTDSYPAGTGPAACPRCGGGNGCAAVRQSQADSCWCMRIPLSVTELERVRELYPAATCLCRSCLLELTAKGRAD